VDRASPEYGARADVSDPYALVDSRGVPRLRKSPCDHASCLFV